jgi:hypothetical protein
LNQLIENATIISSQHEQALSKEEKPLVDPEDVEKIRQVARD